ncbi:MAG TPA: 6-phosphogluconolactonase [Bacteroidia bacterium]|nr:6-phosphogluconolactonase [Bacteroidia bacterium]
MKATMTSSENKIKVYNSIDALNYAVAEFIIDIANNSIEKKGKCVIALSGGQTPLSLYSLLAQSPFKEQLPRNKITFFWTDERYVPATDKRNNANQARTILLNKVNIPPTNIHAIPVDLSPAEAAQDYEKEIKASLGEPALFDLILLGLGENGHTASLFPGTIILKEEEAYVKETYVEEEKMYRISMTAPLINQSCNIAFLVTGKNKATVLKDVLNGAYQPDKYPAQLIQPKEGHLFWFIDSEAAALLKN